MSELKPCPFCGCNRIHESAIEPSLTCLSCSAFLHYGGKDMDGREILHKHWNTRAADAELERLAEIGRRWEKDSSLESWFPITAEELSRLRGQVERLREGLERISNHWAIQYDHPNMKSEMYQGQYGIGVTDGHRCCAGIARETLAALERKE